MISLQKSGLMSVVHVAQIFMHPLRNTWKATSGFTLIQKNALVDGNE
jgi:hypothetical protein